MEQLDARVLAFSAMGLISGCFSTLLIQKGKVLLGKKPKRGAIALASLLVNLGAAFGWVYVLGDIPLDTGRGVVSTVLIGLIGFIGADMFYKSLRNRWSFFSDRQPPEGPAAGAGAAGGAPAAPARKKAKPAGGSKQPARGANAPQPQPEPEIKKAENTPAGPKNILYQI